MKQPTLTISIIFMFLIFFILSCSKSTDVSPASTISDISPRSGQPGTTVTITGTGFGTTLAENTVSFNGVMAQVTSATSTLLTVTVPSGATGGNISVAVNGKTTIGPAFAFYNFYAFGV